MNPFTNAVVIGIAFLLFYVAELPWLGLTVLGLRLAWWVFYEVVTTRELKRRRAASAPVTAPAPSPRMPVTPVSPRPNATDLNTPEQEGPKDSLPSSSDEPSDTPNVLFCTRCGTARKGAGLFCVECGTTFPS